jgi:hypothetical protein
MRERGGGRQGSCVLRKLAQKRHLCVHSFEVIVVYYDSFGSVCFSLDFFFLKAVKQRPHFEGNELSMIRLKEVQRSSKGNRRIALFPSVALLLFVPGECGRLLAERMSEM